MNILIGLLSKYVFGVVIKYIMEQIFYSIMEGSGTEFSLQGNVPLSY